MARETTTAHDVIQRWADEREGKPSIIRLDGKNRLRVDFGEPEEGLEQITWGEFFTIFDDKNLEFVYEEETADGEQSLYYKFIDRDSPRDAIEGDEESDDEEDEVEEEDDEEEEEDEAEDEV